MSQADKLDGSILYASSFPDTITTALQGILMWQKETVYSQNACNIIAASNMQNAKPVYTCTTEKNYELNPPTRDD